MPRKPLFLIVPLLALSLASLLARPRPDAEPGPETSLDALLGKNQRRAFAEGLAKREYGGKTHAWERYVSWGRALAVEGGVKDPPIEPSPSTPLAETYRCVHCHNLTREDLKLTVQDPERREKLIREAKPLSPEKRDGAVLSLTPGTTLWGAVNRESFYNGHYDPYRALRVRDGSRMKPESVSDAIQVCCSYCSAGRFPEPWELDSLLAFLWSLELRLKDLDLPEEEVQGLLKQLKSVDEETVFQARQALRRTYRVRAGADGGDEPIRTRDALDSYADGTNYTGNAQYGRLLYRSACAGCHGGVHPKADGELVASDALFHRYVWKGTERDGLYMPLFTRQRLSRQQAADIRVYLHSAGNTR